MALRMMKSSDGGSAGKPGEQVDGQVERTPPGVDRRRPSSVRAPETRPARAPPGWRPRSSRSPGLVIAGVLVCPRRAGRSTGPPGASGRSPPGPRGGGRRRAPRGSRLPTDRSASGRHRSTRPPLCSTTRLVDPQVQHDDERPRTVRRRQRGGLPTPGGQPQRRVLQLRLGRCELAPPACRAAGCGRAACRTSRSTARRRPPASPTWPYGSEELTLLAIGGVVVATAAGRPRA